MQAGQGGANGLGTTLPKAQEHGHKLSEVRVGGRQTVCAHLRFQSSVGKWRQVRDRMSFMVSILASEPHR